MTQDGINFKHIKENAHLLTVGDLQTIFGKKRYEKFVVTPRKNRREEMPIEKRVKLETVWDFVGIKEV